MNNENPNKGKIRLEFNNTNLNSDKAEMNNKNLNKDNIETNNKNLNRDKISIEMNTEFRGPKKKTKIIALVLLPILIVGQYFALKKGILSPMVKGIDIQVIGGNYIKNIDKYVVKLGDTVTLSAGDFIIVPKFAKKPSIWFNVLDSSGVLTVEGDKLKANKLGMSSIGVMKKNRVLKKANIRVVDPSVQSLDIDFNKPIKYYGDESLIKSHVIIEDYESLEDGNKAEYKSSDESILKVKGNKIKAVGVGNAKIIVKYNKKVIETPFSIEPRVDKIKVEKIQTIELDEKRNLKAKPIYQPAKASAPKLSYKYRKPLLTKDRVALVDDKGNILGKKIGEEKILISSADKDEEVLIKVIKKSTKNIKIKNVKIHKLSDNLIYLAWDKEDDLNTYLVYHKPVESDKFILISTTKSGVNQAPFDLKEESIDQRMGEYFNGGSKGDRYYVVGFDGVNLTQKSDQIEYK